jgi:hypothetical protein
VVDVELLCFQATTSRLLPQSWPYTILRRRRSLRDVRERLPLKSSIVFSRGSNDGFSSGGRRETVAFGATTGNQGQAGAVN